MGGSGTTNPFTGAVEFYKGTMDGPVPSFYQSLLPDSNMEVAVDPKVEDAPRSGLDGFFKSIEKLQNANNSHVLTKKHRSIKFVHTKTIKLIVQMFMHALNTSKRPGVQAT